MDLTATPQAVYENETFKNLEHPSALIDGITFYDCTFQGCTFTEATFNDCKFVTCTFQQCDLSLIHVDHSAFNEARFEDCKIAGVDWTQARWGTIIGVEPLNFFRSTLNYSTFIGLKLKRIHIVDCTALDVDFTDAALVKAVCTGTDFSESRFMRTDLTEADFTGASNYAINPTANTLKKTKFALPEAVNLLYSLDIVLVDIDAALDVLTGR